MLLTLDQLFTVTTNNAISNNIMVEAIPTKIDSFGGEKDHILCFNHIINLITKSLLRLFDIPKVKGASSSYKDLDGAEEELRQLGDAIEIEDLKTQIRRQHYRCDIPAGI
jgi:hypothetical protein